MKKIILFFLFCVCLQAEPIKATVKKVKFIDDIFTEGQSDISKKIKNAVKDKYGWNKKVIEQRLKEGIYTETQLKTYHKKQAEIIVKADVQEKHDKIKPGRVDNESAGSGC